VTSASRTVPSSLRNRPRHSSALPLIECSATKTPGVPPPNAATTVDGSVTMCPGQSRSRLKLHTISFPAARRARTQIGPAGDIPRMVSGRCQTGCTVTGLTPPAPLTPRRSRVPSARQAQLSRMSPLVGPPPRGGRRRCDGEHADCAGPGGSFGRDRGEVGERGQVADPARRAAVVPTHLAAPARSAPPSRRPRRSPCRRSVWTAHRNLRRHCSVRAGRPHPARPSHARRRARHGCRRGPAD
jgi:hypothetical protein